MNTICSVDAGIVTTGSVPLDIVLTNSVWFGSAYFLMLWLLRTHRWLSPRLVRSR